MTMRTLLSKTAAIRFIDPDHSETSVVLWFDTPEGKADWLKKVVAARVTEDDIAVARELITNWESR